jgi:thiol-disulfide isomerase/thioredoxin
MRTLLTRALPAAAVIAAAGLGGFLAYGWIAARVGPSPVVPMPQGRVALQSAGGPQAAPSVPDGHSEVPGSATRPLADTLPDIAFADRAGILRRLSDWKGRPLLVNFWATWCAPCREETPLLERLSRERAQDGLEVIGVAVDSRPAVLDYARREAIPYPLLIGERPGLELIHALGMQAVFPFSVFVDAAGRIVTVKIGVLHADQARLILDRLQELDRGRIDLATARREIADGIRRLAIGRATGHWAAHSMRPSPG